MAEFSPSEAAFTGFRIVRERPRAVAFWAAALFLVSLAGGLAMSLFGGAAFLRLQTMSFAERRDPGQALAIFHQVWPIYGAMTAFSLVFYSIVLAAMSRAVLRPGEDRFGYLRLGADEVRQFGLLLLALLVALGVYVLSAIVGIIISVVIMLLLGLAGRNSAGGAPAIVLLVMTVVVLAAMIGVEVRLSLASPLTFATRRVDLFGSWRLTRRRFWPIFGTYLLAFALMCVVCLLGLAVISAAVAVAGGGVGALSVVFRPDFSSPVAFLSAPRLIYLVGSGVVSALVWPLIFAPAVVIYRSLAPAETGRS